MRIEEMAPDVFMVGLGQASACGCFFPEAIGTCPVDWYEPADSLQESIMIAALGTLVIADFVNEVLEEECE